MVDASGKGTMEAADVYWVTMLKKKIWGFQKIVSFWKRGKEKDGRNVKKKKSN